LPQSWPILNLAETSLLGGPTAKLYDRGMRKHKFENGEFYHIYNRGVDKRIVFDDKEDFDRFYENLCSFNTIDPIGSLFELSFAKTVRRNRPKNKKLVHIVCYCLNPNHFHLILRQCTDSGVSEFMKRVAGGFTTYFNLKNKRSGVLFQGKFKSTHIESNEQLLRVSAYVNLNNRVHKIKSSNYRSSWNEYVSNVSENICKKDIIQKQFNESPEYKTFAEEALEDILKNKEKSREMRLALLE
jgi:putative transposase